MNYQAMTLREEIRRCIYVKGATHPENIRRWIIQDRIGRESYLKMQRLKTITNNLSTMEDLEKVGGYWQFVDESKFTRVTKWVKLFLLNAVLWSCQLTRVIKDLLIKLRS